MIIHIGPENPLVLWAKTRVGRAAFATSFCAAFTLLMLFAVPMGWRQYLLSRHPQHAAGEVLETHTFGGDPDTHTEINTAVRYRFVVGGRTFAYVGPTGGAWADVSKEEMDSAAQTGRIDVIYDPSDPGNNAPATKQRWLLAWAGGLIGGTGLLTTATWVWVARVARDEVRHWTGTGQPARSAGTAGRGGANGLR